MGRKTLLAILIALVAGLASSARAVIYLGSPAAAAALQFDPYHPDAALPVVTKSVTADEAKLTTISAQNVIEPPTGIVTATTTTTGGTIYICVHDAPTVYQTSTGTTVAQFTVTLSQASSTPVVFHYETVDGTAHAGTGYLPAFGWLTFQPGQTSITVDVTVLPSGPRPPSLQIEIFYLELIVDPTSTGYVGPAVFGATILCKTGQVQIVAPPAPVPHINVVSAGSVQQSSTKTTTASFKVTLSSASATTVSFHFLTVNGTALAGKDYVAKTGWLNFMPGQTSVTIPVTVSAEPHQPAIKTFYLKVDSVTSGATIQTSEGSAVIDPPTVVINVGNAGTIQQSSTKTETASFKVTLSNTSSEAVDFHYTTLNGTALAGKDYTAKSGNLDISAGQTTITIPVTVLAEPNNTKLKTFYLQLSTPSGGTIGTAEGSGVIKGP